MSWHTSQLSYALGLGGIMSFYGAMAVLAYWLPGNVISDNQRIIFVAFLLLTLPFALLFSFVRSRRERKRAAAEAAAEPDAETPQPDQAAAPVKAAGPVGTNVEIDSGIQEVVDFLKSSNLGAAGKDAVYSLPWYIVAGPSKSGKSSLIIGSNLDFRTTASQRESEQRLVRPTKGVDWRVTSEGVFIDTTGRYQAEGSVADDWSVLLEAIKKHRPGRPIDGFILVVDADQTLKSDEQQNEQAAKVLRTRLDDAVQRLKVRFPVYLVFSHADGIEGFSDSFSVTKNEAKNLVWGATIPIEKSENAQAQFDPEFELLRDAVMKRRIVRLSAPFPAVKQLRIFNFPLHFGSARRKIGAFVAALFRPNPFSENPFLRGFYFASNVGARSAANIPPTVGSSYFTERLFRDVILRDRDLVATFLAQKQRPPIFGWALTTILAGLVTLLLILSGVSLYNNKKLLDEATDRGEKLLAITRTDAFKDPSKADERSLRNELNTTEDLRQLLVKLDDYERNGAPWYMRFGLYSGNRVYKQNLLKIYMAVIENRYKTATIKSVETDLRKFADSDPVANPGKLTDKEEDLLSKKYDLLKAYLMLTGQFKDKADAGFIAATFKDYWTSDAKIPPDMKLVSLQQLDFWAKQVDRNDSDYSFPRIMPDGKLVDDARKKLQAFPAVYRYYKRKVSEISREIDEKLGPMSVDAILARNGADANLLDGSYTVPGAYTKSGFVLMKKAITEANDKLSEDDWVMGELGKKEVAQTTDAAKIEDRYLRDYADQWRAFIKATTVRPYKNKDAAQAALQTFSSANSPMKVLLTEVAKNTNLSAKPEATGWWEWIKSWFTRDDTPDTGGDSQPEKEFRPLFVFIGKKEDKENAPVEKYRSEIGKVSNAINGLSADALKQVAQELANDQDRLGIRRSETAISNLIQGFSETPSSQDVAELIQEPLGNLRALLGADAKSQIAKQWNDQVLPAAKEIEKCYPFDASDTECDMTKVSAFLNPADGLLSKFYTDRLQKYFEESNGVLKLKDTAEVKFSDKFVAYLNSAFAIRKALYGSSQTPKFEYGFSLKPGKDSLIEVVIDGQKITSEGTSSINGVFPAAASAETGVVVTTGTSAAAATAGNSNTATAPAAPGTLKFPGTWGLFRFVDAGHPSKQASGEYSLSYSVGGKSVSASIKPNGGDLFDREIFKAVRAPQSLFE